MAITKLKALGVTANTITASQIANDTITNTQINSSAAIASSKLGVIGADKVVDGTRVLIHSQTLSSEATAIIFNSTYITDIYDDYILEGKFCTPTVDGAEAVIHCSSDNGSNMATSGHARSYLRLAANAVQGAEAGTNNYIQIATDTGNRADRGLTFEARFFGLRNTTHYKYMFFESCGRHTNDEYQWRGGSSIAVTTAINYLAFMYKPSGNIKAGAKVALYGIKGSNYS